MHSNTPTVFAALLTAVSLSALTSTPVSATETREPVVGTWVCSGGPAPPFQVIKTFAAEGTMMEFDNITFQESPTVGMWKRTGTLQYFLVARQFVFNPDGTWAGTYLYSQPLVMNPSLTSMQGTFHARFVDPSGIVTDAGGGEVSCSRLTFAG